MIYLRADTATEVLIGPAIAVGDGFTPVTTLVLTSADEAELIKYNAATTLTGAAITNALAALTSAVDGYYSLELTTGELDTEGPLWIVIQDDSLILPLRHEFMVINANTYDAFYAVAGTDLLQVDQTEIVGGAVPAPTTTGVPDVNVERWLDTLVTLGAGAPDVNVASMDANSIAVGVLATNSIGVLAMAAGSISDGTIAAAELTNIEDEIWDALKSGHVVANSFGDFLDTEVSGVGGGGPLASSTTTSAGTSTTFIDTARTEIDDTWIGALVVFTSGTEANRCRLITEFDAATDTATFTPAVSAAVASGVTYEIHRHAGVDVQSWLGLEGNLVAPNALVGGAVDADVSAMQAGSIAAGVLAAATLTEIEDEIWDALKAAHTTPDSFGDYLDDEITSRQVLGDVTIAASGIPVGAFVAGSITAAAIAAAAMNGKGDWNIGKAGYSLTQTFPSNFADMAIAITTGEVDANLTEYLGAATPALVGGRFDSSVGAMAANVITAAAINAAAITAAKFAAGAIDANALATAAITAAKIATDAIGATELAADAVTKIRDAILPVQNIALPNIPFTFVAASDHVTPVTGATGTAVTRSIDGGGFGAGTGTISEVANGAYSYDASAADMNGGIIMFRFTGTGGTPGAPDDTFVSVITGAGV